MQTIVGANGVKVYNLSSGKSLPDWLSTKKKTALRKDEEFRRRIELIQDFEFPIASKRIRVSKDGQFVLATGIYPPALRCYELSQLSLKFERRLDSAADQFIVLSDDFAKIALLHGPERTVEFHAQFGSYYRVRVPRPARDMLYHPQSCDLYVCGSTRDVWRLNLEQGRFLNPIELSAPSSCSSACDVCPAHSLLAFGSDEGIVECFDPRTRSSCASVACRSHLPQDSFDSPPAITALSFCSDGLTLGVGTSSGHAMLYDLRAPRPYLTKVHQNATPIVSLRFHDGSEGAAAAGASRPRVISADQVCLKVWDKRDGGLLFAIEPAHGKLSEVVNVGSSGMLLAVGEFKRMKILYAPALGPAPRWCAFLDNLTEELEEQAPNIYADYKFVTKEELAHLGLDRLIGTSYLRAYMHGYFVDMRMYKKVRDVVDPFGYEQYHKSLVKAKLDAKSATRIFARTKLPKVNAKLAERLMVAQQSEKGPADGATDSQQPPAKKGKVITPLLSDPRFAAMFTNEDFERNEAQVAREESAASRRKAKEAAEVAGEEDGLEEHFAAVRDEGEEVDEGAEVYELKTGQSLDAAMEAISGSKRKREEMTQAGSFRRKAATTLESRVKSDELSERKRQAKENSRGPKILGSGRGLAPGVREMSFVPEKELRKAREKSEARSEALERERISRRPVGRGFSSRGRGFGGRGRGRGRK